jgi:hypothetical protein
LRLFAAAPAVAAQVPDRAVRGDVHPQPVRAQNTAEAPARARRAGPRIAARPLAAPAGPGMRAPALDQIVPDIVDQHHVQDLVRIATGARTRPHVPGQKRIEAEARARLDVRVHIPATAREVRVAVAELLQAGHAQGRTEELSRAADDRQDRGSTPALVTGRLLQDGQRNRI